MSADVLILWRHARTSSNADGRFQGQLDVDLDDVGRKQAEQAADALADRLRAAPGPVRIVSSDLSRASNTAAALAARLGLEVRTDPGLRERHGGAWQGLLREEIKQGFPEEFAQWRAGEDLAIGGGERLSEAALRAERALVAHLDGMDGGALVAVCHGGSGRGGLLRLIGLGWQTYRCVEPLRNGHWAEVVRRGGSWVLATYNVGPPGQPSQEA